MIVHQWERAAEEAEEEADDKSNDTEALDDRELVLTFGDADYKIT